MLWVGRDLQRPSSPNPLQWAGTSATGSGCSEPRPTRPGKFPGMGHQSPLWATSARVSPPSLYKNLFLVSNLYLPSLSWKPLLRVLSQWALLKRLSWYFLWEILGNLIIPTGNSYRKFYYTGCKEETSYNEGVETLAQVAQRGGRYLVPGDIQGQVGRGSEHTDLIEGVPAHCRGVGLDGPQQSLPSQSILWFHDILEQFCTLLKKGHLSSCVVLPKLLPMCCAERQCPLCQGAGWGRDVLAQLFVLQVLWVGRWHLQWTERCSRT